MFVRFLCFLLAPTYLCILDINRQATISFDEGPDKYFHVILEILRRNNIIATFYCQPDKITRENTADIIGYNQILGISITDDILSLNEVEFEKFLIEKINLFIKNTGFRPKVIRLPKIGYKKEHVKIAEKLNLVVTRPNVDSEDTDHQDFFKMFVQYFKYGRVSNISLCFRDRIKKTIERFNDVVVTLKKYNYIIVHPTCYYDRLVQAIPVFDDSNIGIDTNPESEKVHEEQLNKVDSEKKGNKMVESDKQIVKTDKKLDDKNQDIKEVEDEKTTVPKTNNQKEINTSDSISDLSELLNDENDSNSGNQTNFVATANGNENENDDQNNETIKTNSSIQLKDYHIVLTSICLIVTLL